MARSELKHKSRQQTSSPSKRGAQNRPIRGQRAVTPTPAHRQAKRKRTMSRRMRRFEQAVARWQPQMGNARQIADSLHATGWRLSKIASALLVVLSATAIILIHTQADWFVYAENVHFNHLKYVQSADLFRLTQVDGWNIFWLHPQDIRERLLQNPFVSDARVALKLPGTVTITVQEQNPVALWVTNAGTFWLAPDGAAVPVQGKPDPQLPQIIDSLQEARSVSGATTPAIDPQILSGSLTLLKALPELENKVRFNHSIGLNFQLPQLHVWVYWGDGLQMEKKLEDLTAMRKALIVNNAPAQIVDVRFVDRPYWR